MPSSDNRKTQPLDGNPPSFAEIFKIDQASGDTTVVDLKPDRPSTPVPIENIPSSDRPQLEGLLSPCAAGRSGELVARALRLASVDKLPSYYSSEDARKVVRYVEANTKELKSALQGADANVRGQILGEVDKLFGSGLETKRSQVLLRWFRDRVTPANLNPSKLVDPEAEARGNILQIFHPVVFNAGMYVLILVLTFLTFAFFFRGTN